MEFTSLRLEFGTPSVEVPFGVVHLPGRDRLDPSRLRDYEDDREVPTTFGPSQSLIAILGHPADVGRVLEEDLFDLFWDDVMFLHELLHDLRLPEDLIGS